jgi:hypothetical protein
VHVLLINQFLSEVYYNSWEIILDIPFTLRGIVERASEGVFEGISHI